MKVTMNEDVKSKCICMSCPTYTQNSLMGGVFCAMGTSAKMPEMKGCNCPGCKVYDEYDLKGGYYCIKGASE